MLSRQHAIEVSEHIEKFNTKNLPPVGIEFEAYSLLPGKVVTIVAHCALVYF